MHSESHNLKAVCHSFQKIYDILWSIKKDKVTNKVVDSNKEPLFRIPVVWLPVSNLTKSMGLTVFIKKVAGLRAGWGARPNGRSQVCCKISHVVLCPSDMCHYVSSWYLPPNNQTGGAEVWFVCGRCWIDIAIWAVLSDKSQFVREKNSTNNGFTTCALCCFSNLRTPHLSTCTFTRPGSAWPPPWQWPSSLFY